MFQLHQRERPADAPGGTATQKSAHATGGKDCGTRRSSYTGLTYDKNTCTWRVRVNVKSKQHHVGRFKEENEAAAAYDCAALLLIGPTAAVNFGAAAARAAMPKFLNRINITALMRLKQSLAEQSNGRRSSNSGSGSGGGGRDAVASAAAAVAGWGRVETAANADTSATVAGMLAVPGMPAPWGAFGSIGGGAPASAPASAPISCPLPLIGGPLSGAGPAGNSAPISPFSRFVPCGPLPGSGVAALSAPLYGSTAPPPPLGSNPQNNATAGALAPLPGFYAALAAAAAAPQATTGYNWGALAPQQGAAPLMALLPDRDACVTGPGDSGDDGDEDDSRMDAEWLCIRPTKDDTTPVAAAAAAAPAAPCISCDGSSAPPRGAAAASGGSADDNAAQPAAPRAMSEAGDWLELDMADLDDQIDHMVRHLDTTYTNVNRTVLAAAAAATAAAAPLQQGGKSDGRESPDGYQVAFAAAAAAAAAAAKAAAAAEEGDCDGDDADSGAASRRRSSAGAAFPTPRTISLASTRSDVSSYPAATAAAAAAASPTPTAAAAAAAAATLPALLPAGKGPFTFAEETDDCQERKALYYAWATEDNAGSSKQQGAAGHYH